MPRQLSLLGHFPSLGDHDPEKWFLPGVDLGLLVLGAGVLALSAAVLVLGAVALALCAAVRMVL